MRQEGASFVITFRSQANELSLGEGWVVLTGIHAEATERWRGGLNFTTPASVDNEYAAKLIRAALERQPLPHY